MSLAISVTNIIDNVELILQLTTIASMDKHRNAVNYENFGARIKNYKGFYVVKEDDTYLAMSGIYQGDHWDKDLARIGDRNYYFPIARSKTLGFKAANGYTAYNSDYLVPTQKQWCLENGITNIFLSIQEINRRPALQKMLKYQKSKGNFDFAMLKDMYYTCNEKYNPDVYNPKCWQSVISYKGKDINLPKRPIESIKNVV